MTAPNAELSRLQRIMGHASPETTSRYVHHSIDENGHELVADVKFKDGVKVTEDDNHDDGNTDERVAA